MKPRRHKGATLGLVAVSVLVIIVIGIGCYFLIKLCGGGPEVANSTDAGTLNVAKAALRTQYASAPVPPGTYQNFLACLDPAISSPGNEKISLLTYNRCVAQALLIALNAQDSGNPQAIAFANQVWNDLQTIGTNLSNSIMTDNRWRDAAFNGLATNNNLKMFGNNNLALDKYRWAFMRPGGSSNIYFSAFTFGTQTDPATGNSFTYPVLSNGVPPAGMYYTGPQTTTVRPRPTDPNFGASPYMDLGSNPATNYAGGNTSFNNMYMAGYQPIGPVLGHTFMGVPVFPNQKPHLVQLGEFNNSLGNLDPNGFTPPNAFSITTKSLDSKSNTFGGAVSAAIVGTTFSISGGGDMANLGGPSGPGPSGGTGYNGQPTNQFDFIGELPVGYIQIVNDPVSGTGANGFTGGGDGTNNIFNWELNPVGGGPGVNLAGPSANGSDVFFQDSGSAASTVQSWADYNTAGDPAAPATWNDTANNNPAAVGPPTSLNPNATLPGVFVSINGGQSSRAATSQDMLGLTGKGQNCLQDLINNNMGYPNSPDKCGNNLNAMSSAFGRSMGGGGSTDPQIAQYWSNVDAIKAQINQAFNTPYVGVQAPSGKSGLGAYKVAKTGGSAPAIAWNAGSNPPLEKVSSVMDILNQVGGCATSKVTSGIWERCNQITPGISYNDVVSLLTSTTIGMGQKLYIQRQNPSNPMSPLCIQATAPQDSNGQVTNILALNSTKLPDGNSAAPAATCDSGPYDLYNGGRGLIDTQVGNSTGDGKGDNNLHDQPYTNVSSTLEATDHANFTTSSGYAGMLGKLEFYQTTTGAGAFSRPN